MLTYSFENIGEESLYEHLYRCIRADILAGRLQAGEKLPSKRSLARQLGISVITVEGTADEATARIAISDHGRTIPARKLDMLFDKFYRLDSSRSSADGGAGLGLSIARQITEAHGGSIAASSADGVTTFTVTLPVTA